MESQKLTKRVVDAITPTGKTVIHYDSELSGFGLKVLPSGAKRWCVEYRSGAGGRKVGKTRMVLGSTSTMTPDQARQSARTILGAVALGQDPARKRTHDRAMPTFAEFGERYLTEEAETKLKPRTVVNYRIYLRKHATPVIGTRKLDALETDEIAKMHRKIGKTNPMTANRVVEFVSSVFRYAAVCGLVPRGHNPTAQVSAFREQRRERFLNSAELARLGDAIREAETAGIPWEVDKDQPNAKHIPKNARTKLGPHVVAALRLLILTGARLREILSLKWEYVDLERGLLLLPDSKTGRKAIILNAPAIAVLKALPQVDTYVIAGDIKNQSRHDLNRPWRSISARAGLSDVRIHDLRHTHASYGAGAGFGLPIIGKLLGHSQPATTARYAHLDNDPLKQASESIGSKLARAMGDIEPDVEFAPR
ncbi:tyrosine-type recombinase/integrase [Rhodoplanes sp. Z2-YC6860]|uniref:tyrosine-type recombinase/integrase n=1 Tax=Rhodoplanes sp. Z2-YC6860 TaxID=674703 RepID=UPI00078C96FE|nr:site-specific integrase [Rhodoplanes sp. Z2-YC6860]AMN39734.1 tyrosine site-specific integrase/recombinase [Rhodoplanes sp. Z2-YC6860]